jgi:putative ABC transport system ATP-binding protein
MSTTAPTTDAPPALRVNDLHCEFPSESAPVLALRGIDLTIATSSFVAIMGPSGSGKTTLLNCAAGLQPASHGTVELAGQTLADSDRSALARLRRQRLGFVFQSFNLLPALTAAENVELPLRLDGRRPDPKRTSRLLTRVGLGTRMTHRPDQLSGGQRQRVAIARALITEPEIIFADEPTGALDIHSARDVLTLLRELADNGQTIVMVTHDPVAAAFSDRVLFLADGLIVDQLTSPNAQEVARRMAVLVESTEQATRVSGYLR